MKTQNNKTVKKLKLTKEIVTVLNKEQQQKIKDGAAGDIKGGEAKTGGSGGQYLKEIVFYQTISFIKIHLTYIHL